MIACVSRRFASLRRSSDRWGVRLPQVQGLLAAAIVLLGLVPAAAQEESKSKLPPRDPDPNVLYSLPYAPGTTYDVGQGYGDWPTHEDNYSIDWSMPEGTRILAARAGRVVEVIDSYREHGLEPQFHGKENLVIIEHEDGTRAMYVHLAPQGARVKVGERVSEGQVVALSGNTGYSESAHLHFMVYRNGNMRESIPVLFKSGEKEPYEIWKGGKYRAPGGTPRKEVGPLAGIQGTGELMTIRKSVLQVIRDNPKSTDAAERLLDYLREHREEFHDKYRAVFERAQGGDKTAMREMQDYMNVMDLQSEPAVAKLLGQPDSAKPAQDAMQIWWSLFALP